MVVGEEGSWFCGLVLVVVLLLRFFFLLWGGGGVGGGVEGQGERGVEGVAMVAMTGREEEDGDGEWDGEWEWGGF